MQDSSLTTNQSTFVSSPARRRAVRVSGRSYSTFNAANPSFERGICKRMGKPKGDVGRSKMRPSSSSLAASLLPAGVSTVGFGGYFGSSPIDSSSSVEDSAPFSVDIICKFPAAIHDVYKHFPSYPSALLCEVLSLCFRFEDVDTDMAQHLKRLGRKDPTTKLKALTALAALFEQKTTEEIVQIVPQWAFEYKKLLHEYNREVRRATHDTMTGLVSAIRRGLAPHLKSLMGPWWYSQFDPIPEVSQAARRSFETAFPTPERRLDALMFSITEILLYLDENLKLTPQAMSDKSIPADELADMLQRAVSSSLLAIATLIDILMVEKMANRDSESHLPVEKVVSRARAATISSVENMLATHKCFLHFMKSNYATVRTATYSLLTSIIKNIPSAIHDDNMKVLSTAILGTFQEKDASCHSSMWDMILIFSKKFPNGWSYCNIERVVFSRFWQFLRNGCYGSQQISYPVLVLFLNSIPTGIDLGEQFIIYFFQNLWAGRHSSCYSAADTLTFFDAFKDCFLWVLRNASRYVTEEGKSDYSIKLINDILVELLLKDYLLSAIEKKQYENFPAVPDVSNDNSSELSYERSTQRINSSVQAGYVQELVRCIVVILLDISVEDINLLRVFSTSFLKDCLKIIQQGDSLQNFHEYVERIVRFFLQLDQLVLQKGYDWALHLFGRPLFLTTLPVIKTMDSPDAIKMLSVLADIFGPVTILSKTVSPYEVDVELDMKHFLQAFNSDFVPWCLQILSKSTNLKLDFLLGLIQEDYFPDQWCTILTYSIKQAEHFEASSDFCSIDVLAMLLEKVRERIRSNKVKNLLKCDFLPEHWRHDMLDSAAIAFAQKPSMNSSHARFLCAVLGGSDEDDKICFLSEKALIIVWEGILMKIASFVSSSSFHWIQFACSSFLCFGPDNLLKLQDLSFSMKLTMANFAFEVLNGSCFCLKNIDDNCSLVPSILATLFIVDWDYSTIIQICHDDCSDSSEHTKDIVISILAAENTIDNDLKESKLIFGRRIRAFRHNISATFWKSLSPDTRTSLISILVQTIRFALLNSDDLVSPKISLSCCEWVLDITEILCQNKEELQILLDQLLCEGQSWPFWVRPFIHGGINLATTKYETASMTIDEGSHNVFVAFVDKLISRLGVDVVVAGVTETLPGAEALSSFSSPYRREWVAAEMISSWEWEGNNVTDSFLPLLSEYAKSKTSTSDADIILSCIKLLLDGAVAHGAHDKWIFSESWNVQPNDFKKISDPFLRGLVALLSTLLVNEKVWGKFEAVVLLELLLDKLLIGTSSKQSCLRILPFILNILIQSLESSESDGATEVVSGSSRQDNLVRENVVSWLEKCLCFPSLLTGETEQEVEEWIQVVISCYPLRKTVENGKYKVYLLRTISKEESTLLLSLFRKQLFRYDASAAADQISSVSSSTRNSISSMWLQVILGKLTAISVGYCWQLLNEDDWDCVLDRSYRWVEASVLLMEEIAENVDNTIGNTAGKDLDLTTKKLELEVQRCDPLVLNVSTSALIILCLFSQLEDIETESTEGLQLIRLGKWADMKNRTMKSILRLLFATGATEAITRSCNEVLSTLIASSRLSHSDFWGLVASFVNCSPMHVKSAAVESMELWGLSKGSVNSLYAILFSSRPISSLQFAAFSMLSSEPLCHVSVGKYSSMEGTDSSFVESELSSDVELYSEENFCLRDEISFLIQKPSSELVEVDLVSQDRVNLFLAWALLLSSINSLSSSSKAREKIVQYIQDSVSSNVLDCIFQHIPLKTRGSNVKKKEPELVAEASKAANAAKHSITTCSLTFYVQSLWPIGTETMASLAGSIYGMMVLLLPSFVRNWFSNLRDRFLSSAVESFTKAWCSPPLLLEELSQVKEAVFDYEDFSVSLNTSTFEITATYKKEEPGVDLVIRLPSSYPLRPVDVECIRSQGISEVRLRKWLLSAFNRNQSGAIAEAIRIWKSNFDKEECPICYSTIHATNHTLPRLACKTCKHKFHSACLYKWFSTSHKSTCPLCQSPF